MRSINLLQLMRIAAGVVAVIAATSIQESELPYRIMIASRTLGGASRRIRSASMAASAAGNGVSGEVGAAAAEKSMKTRCAFCFRRPNFLPPEPRENSVHVFVFLRREVGK